jgi:bifunctional DNA-binding transcriptional regulator/antitoxin component of YhaV-PrlF toxin-antitoxin module
MRITSKGQVTIPQVIREKYGFMPETDIEFVERDGYIAIQRRDLSKPDRVHDFLERLSGSATVQLSTDEIMTLSRDFDERRGYDEDA